MKIRLNPKRKQRAFWLPVIALGIALVLGGCAVHGILNRLNHINDRINNKNTNDPPEELGWNYIPKKDHELVNLGETNAVPTNEVWKPIDPIFQAAPPMPAGTNWYNEALEDESGF